MPPQLCPVGQPVPPCLHPTRLSPARDLHPSGAGWRCLACTPSPWQPHGRPPGPAVPGGPGAAGQGVAGVSLGPPPAAVCGVRGVPLLRSASSLPVLLLGGSPSRQTRALGSCLRRLPGSAGQLVQGCRYLSSPGSRRRWWPGSSCMWPPAPLRIPRHRLPPRSQPCQAPLGSSCSRSCLHLSPTERRWVGATQGALLRPPAASRHSTAHGFVWAGVSPPPPWHRGMSRRIRAVPAGASPGPRPPTGVLLTPRPGPSAAGAAEPRAGHCGHRPCAGQGTHVGSHRALAPHAAHTLEAPPVGREPGAGAGGQATACGLGRTPWGGLPHPLPPGTA